VLLVVGALCLVAFGIIGAVITNGAPLPGRETTQGLSVRRPDWHGVPLHPEADFLSTLSADSSQYTVVGDAAAVSAWFEREWTGIGLHYVETTSLDGTTFRWFETADRITSDQTSGFRTSGHIFGYRRFGYAVTPSESGRSTITLIRLN
jgi:hypothetical protein